jgi:hypothetical protein
MSLNIVRFHDGERFVHGLEAAPGRKYRHIVTITEGGVCVVDLDLREPVESLHPVKPKQLRTFARAGRVFGISKAAQSILATAKEICNA